MKTPMTCRRQQLGFTIIEALIAMAIMGFGILGLAGMQAALSRNADVAKQRTEALRLAQEKIEEYRSFTGVASHPVVATQSVPASNIGVNWNTLPADGNDIIKTNADYARAWSLSGTASDPMRSLNVVVGWTDRASDPASVALTTVVAKSNPADAGFLAFPLPQNTILKRPKNRNFDIPIPSIDLGNGKSAVNFKDPGKYILFDNISGDVTNLCTSTLAANADENQVKSALTNSDQNKTVKTDICPKIKGYIVSGYVDVSLEDGSTKGNGKKTSSTEWTTIKNDMNINYSGLTYTPTSNNTTVCQFGDAKNQNTGVVIDDYKYYLCLISWPAPSDNSTDNQVYQWSGTMRLSAPAAWNTSSTKYYVCRFQYAETSILKDPNQRNVQAYVNVNKSIDQQNYFAAYTTTTPTNETCSAANKITMNVPGVSAGVLHQNCSVTACPTN